MAEISIIGETLCPWCHNGIEVVRSSKSGYHYANCTSCNSHFRNIPVALVDMRGKQETKAEPEVEGDALDRFLEKHRQAAEPEVGESPLERLRREFGQNKQGTNIHRPGR